MKLTSNSNSYFYAIFAINPLAWGEYNQYMNFEPLNYHNANGMCNG